jgi:hypothetical protein
MCRFLPTFAAFLALIELTACRGSGASGPLPSTDPPLQYPSRLTFAGVGTHGIFDASLAQAPGASRVWMSYSAVEASVQWPSANPDVVASRIAYSDNQGRTWKDAGAVNQVVDVDLSVPLPATPGGSWINEVSSLVYDPGAPVAQRWKLFWHHYLTVHGVRGFEHGWLALKMAASPEQLAQATEIKLFSSMGYNSANDTQGGITKSPLGGPPAISLTTALGEPELNGCLFTEPGPMATASALYLSMLCVKSVTDHRIVLFKCASPCDPTQASSWDYLGSTLSDADAAAAGFNQGYSAPALFSSGGKSYLIATPVANAPWDSYYSGCRVFEFDNLETAALKESGGVPVAVKTIQGTAGSFNGACSYAPGASQAGVVLSEHMLSVVDRFRLFLTGVKL